MASEVLVNGEPIKYQLCPNGAMIEGLARYFEYGILPGSFLQALLKNDLRGTCEQADDRNRHLVFEWVSWLYNYAPTGSWGSEENVARYSADRRYARSADRAS